MSTQHLATYNGSGVDSPAKRRTDARGERALLLAAKMGDLVAFEMLCKQSANTVFHLARRILRNNEDAEDVVQESFQQAFVHLNRFNGDSRISTWLSRIAINAALMKLRKKHHQWNVSLDEPAETAGLSSRIDIEDQGPNPEQLYGQMERRRILSEAINQLRVDRRKVVVLRELGKAATEETCE